MLTRTGNWRGRLNPIQRGSPEDSQPTTSSREPASSSHALGPAVQVSSRQESATRPLSCDKAAFEIKTLSDGRHSLSPVPPAVRQRSLGRLERVGSGLLRPSDGDFSTASAVEASTGSADESQGRKDPRQEFVRLREDLVRERAENQAAWDAMTSFIEDLSQNQDSGFAHETGMEIEHIPALQEGQKAKTVQMRRKILSFKAGQSAVQQESCGETGQSWPTSSGAAEASPTAVCACGLPFSVESTFCRKCGTRRDEAINESILDEETIVPEPSVLLTQAPIKLEASPVPAASSSVVVADSPSAGDAVRYKGALSGVSPIQASVSLVSSPPLSVSNQSWASAGADSVPRRQVEREAPLEMISPFQMPGPDSPEKAAAPPPVSSKRFEDSGAWSCDPQAGPTSPTRLVSGHDMKLAAARAALTELQRDLCTRSARDQPEDDEQQQQEDQGRFQILKNRKKKNHRRMMVSWLSIAASASSCTRKNGSCETRCGNVT